MNFVFYNQFEIQVFARKNAEQEYKIIKYLAEKNRYSTISESAVIHFKYYQSIFKWGSFLPVRSSLPIILKNDRS
jgi:hypothetical protein